MSEKVVQLVQGKDSSKSFEAEEFNRSRFLFLDEAVCWVAFQSFNRPNSLGPVHLSDLFASIDALNRQLDEYDAKYWMAFQQVVNAITRGLVPAYGKLHLDPNETEYVKPEDTFEDGLTRLIPPEEIQQSYVTYIDDYLIIGDDFYEFLAVDWAAMRTVFGHIVLDYGDILMGETKKIESPAQPALNEKQLGTKRGRPEKWNWSEIMSEIVLLAASDSGLPKTQAELESWIAEKCLDLYGSEPGISTIRSRIAPIYQRRRNKGQ